MVLKDLIRGLGSNKTENSIITISKAAPVVKQICENVDTMLGVIDKKTRHKKRSFEDDIKEIIKELEPLKPWVKQTGRQLYSFKEIEKSPFSFDRSEFETSVTRTINRLKSDLPPLHNEGDEDEEDKRLTHVIRNSASELNDELKKTPTQNGKNSKKKTASTPASELRFKLTPKREPVIPSLVRSFKKLNTFSLNVKERSGVSRRRIDFDNGPTIHTPRTQRIYHHVMIRDKSVTKIPI
ncbi:unnamed protein product [Mytilus coruscus]|uniref:Uncharacterized protein n=1 Tax=Mytilus coruscus TaxID=42192 RepID=A0A6J8CSB8_MYTCO|nr:unnamed protein product [Mytilus coruscus]